MASQRGGGFQPPCPIHFKKWTSNGPLPKQAATFVPEAIQGYAADYYQANTPAARDLGKRLCNATIAVFPDHVYAYNILAALAGEEGNKDESLRYLKIAHDKAPDDVLILLNLADAYRSHHQTAEALAAYKQVLALKPGDEDKAAANEGIKALSADHSR